MTVDPAALVSMLRRGDVAEAGAAARAGLDAEPDHPLFLTVAGLAAMDMGDPSAGARFLARALALRPSDVANRINLVRALVDAGNFAEAEAVASQGPRDQPDLLRLSAWAEWQRGDVTAAADKYERLVEATPSSVEDWNNLGNVRDAAGDLDGAIAALFHAVALMPLQPAIVVNLARALARAGRHGEARDPLERLLRTVPEDAAAWLELGLTHAATGSLAGAETAYLRALALGEAAAAIELGLLYEHENKLSALRDLAATLDSRDRRGDFVRALAARRSGRIEEARKFAETIPESLDPARRWQLIGELDDRLGKTEAAFAAFERMNAAAAGTLVDASKTARIYREEIVRRNALGPSRAYPWRATSLPDAGRPLPAFIVGFPRSGTTLLDTCLSNLAALDVVEERPMLREVELAAGDMAIATMDAATAGGLRARYFNALDRLASGDPTRRPIDKFPLHMARMPLIHRLFPEAKIVLVERHPCDVVLSCFFTNFELNPAMANFLELKTAAGLYDQVWTVWEEAKSALPLDVHVVRYERLIEAPEVELRAAVDFLGERWDASVLDHRGAAARRGHVATASYAQITEPLYRRSMGRWTRYRQQLEPVMPILEPWCVRMGYQVA